jgi:hypothetical protein
MLSQAWNNANLSRLAQKIKSPLVLYDLFCLDSSLPDQELVAMSVRQLQAPCRQTIATHSLIDILWSVCYILNSLATLYALLLVHA